MKSTGDQSAIRRRDALKLFGLSSAALLSGSFMGISGARAQGTDKATRPLFGGERSSISLASGADRIEMMSEVMEPFEQQIREGLNGKQLVLKPNMVTTSAPLCATHADALRGVLEFMQPIYSGQIIIAESSAGGDSMSGFENYGYLALQEEFDIKFVDLNKTSGSPFWVLDKDLHPDEIQVADMLTDPGYYVISVSRLKTHNSATMTAGTKNIVMAAPQNVVARDAQRQQSPQSGQPGAQGQPSRNQGPSTVGMTGRNIPSKVKMHAGGSRWLHFNMFLLAQQVRPDLTVIDGVEGMQGNGPVRGFPADHRIALAGEDVIAVDSMCSKLMGINVEDVGYLNYCAWGGLGNIDYDKIDVLGGKDPDKYVMNYTPNENIENQMMWKKPLEEEL